MPLLPTREAFAQVDRESAREHFGIAAEEVVLLVFGGSKGAQSINRAVLAGIDALLQRAVVIHVAGAGDWDEVSAARSQLTEAQQTRYLAFKYLHEEMAQAMAAADLAICRAGASVLGELPYLGLPALLVPYPHAWRYQKVNAQYLAGRGAAEVLRDEELADAGRGLVARSMALLEDAAKMSAMRQAMLAAGRRDGAAQIASLLLQVRH